ncbi:MAG: hypothetical protein ACOYEJ_05895 [Mahellales bacterium]|jgi:hypothetical protein
MTKAHSREVQSYHNIRTLTLDTLEEMSVKNKAKDITKYLEDSHDQKNTRNIFTNRIGE